MYVNGINDYRRSLDWIVSSRSIARMMDHIYEKVDRFSIKFYRGILSACVKRKRAA